jgi:hypothetical protein
MRRGKIFLLAAIFSLAGSDSFAGCWCEVDSGIHLLAYRYNRQIGYFVPGEIVWREKVGAPEGYTYVENPRFWKAPVYVRAKGLHTPGTGGACLAWPAGQCDGGFYATNPPPFTPKHLVPDSNDKPPPGPPDG